MTEIFLKVLNMALAGGCVIIVAMLIKLLLKKTPRWIHCAIWGIAALRLTLPFDIRSRLGIISQSEVSIGNINNALASPSMSRGPSSLETVQTAIDTSTRGADLLQISAIVWIIGIAIMLSYAFISYIRLRRRVALSTHVEDNIYKSGNVDSPFILGILKPKIYLPDRLSENEAVYVTMHEKAHLKRFDHLIKPFGFLLLSIYWFNPLVWIAYVLLSRDIELACDEAVMKKLGEDGKKGYSGTLLSCSVNRRAIAACPLAFGETALKKRISGILNYKKPTFWAIAVSIVICLAVGTVLITSPGKKEKPVFPKGDYVFYELIYMNPLSSYMVFEDTGELYAFDETGFTISGKKDGQIIEEIEFEKPEAVSIDSSQWRELFNTNIISTPVEVGGYRSKHMWDLSDKYRLYQMDDELWLMKTNGENLIWSIYGIVPKPEGELEEYKQISVNPTYTRPLDRILSQLVIENNMEKNDGGTIATSAHTILKTVEDEETISIYAVAMYMDFDFSRGRLIEISGSHMPVVATLEKAENGGHALIEYWEPEEGEGYMESIIEKFPSDIGIDSIDTQKYASSHIRACYESAVESTGMDTDAYIKELIEIISSRPSYMSDVESYIQENMEQYLQLLYYGQYTLDYCFNKFEEGGRTGLRGHIMARACAEILADTMSDQPRIVYSTGQEWYEKIKPFLP